MTEDRDRPLSVLADIDAFLAWERGAVAKLEEGKMRLAALLVEAKQGEYWKARGILSEEDYIATTFPQSRSNYYALVAIGENLLPFYPRKLLEELGRSKCEDLCRVQRECGVIPENWFLHAKAEDKDVFRRRVRSYIAERHPPKQAEGSAPGEPARQPRTHPAEARPEIEDEFFTFRIFGEGIGIVRRALEMARLMLGTDKSYGYCLEMICGDFCASSWNDSDGRPLSKNGFLLMVIAHSVQQLDMGEEGCADRLISSIAMVLESQKTNGKEQSCRPQEEASLGS
jgi:hypothetical protein